MAGFSMRVARAFGGFGLPPSDSAKVSESSPLGLEKTHGYLDVGWIKRRIARGIR